MTLRARAGLVAAGLMVAAAAAGLGWYWYTTPVLPAVDLSGEAPAVVEAIEAAQQEVRRTPRSGRAWGELGLVLLGNELGAPAQTCFVQAERFDAANAAWPYLQVRRLLVDDRDAAILALRRAVALTSPLRPDSVTPTLVLAETLFEKDERAEAAALCRQVLEVDPGNLRAEFNLGLIVLAEEQWDAGIAHLARCGRNAYSGKRACSQLAAAYQRVGDSAGAAAFSRSAHELPEDKPWPDPYLQQAEQYAAGPHRHLQHARQLIGTPRTAEYLHALREFAEEAGDGVAHYRLGMALVMMDDHAAAEPVLRTALSKSPDLVGAHYFLGIVVLKQGEQLEAQTQDRAAAQAKFREAATHLRRATELKPAHGQAHLVLGRCLERSGDAAGALAEFRVAVQCHPEIFDFQLALGEALAATGEGKEAVRHLEQARRLAPADPRPPAALARLRDADTKRP
jgi:tetratricopeptide (TPR) repeat protein